MFTGHANSWTQQNSYGAALNYNSYATPSALTAADPVSSAAGTSSLTLGGSPSATPGTVTMNQFHQSYQQVMSGISSMSSGHHHHHQAHGAQAGAWPRQPPKGMESTTAAVGGWTPGSMSLTPDNYR